MWSGEYWLGVHFSYTGAPMRRNSRYTRSASRAKAAWSPLLQAFNRLVISVDEVPMDNPFSPVGQKYTKTWPLLPSASACISGRRTSSENDLLQKDRRHP